MEGGWKTPPSATTRQKSPVLIGLSENFGVFTTSTHQIWLNHVTPGANF